MKLIVITKPTFFVEEDKIIANLFEEGLNDLHLCKPGSSPMYSERLLTLLGDDTASKITVHHHFYLKEEYKLRGIHIDDETTPHALEYPAGKLAHPLQVVGYHHHGSTVLTYFTEYLHDLAAGLGVKISGRLVSQDKLGVVKQRPGYADALLLSA